MACSKEILMLISAYADGETTRRESARAELHLADCPECRARLEAWHGERQMLEWAYTLEIPEEMDTENLKRLAGEDKRMTERGRIARFALHWSWAKAAVAAVLLLAAFVAYYYITTPMMRVGVPMATDTRVKSARLHNDIQLRLGPYTEAVRVDETTVRLKSGYIEASVEHGADFRILTDRMEVLDKGTLFRVGVGPRLDYVIVNEGEVSVTKGREHQRVGMGEIFIAEGKGKGILASIPKEMQEGGPSRKSPLVPTDRISLEWEAKREDLAKRFPEVRRNSGGSGHFPNDSGFETWYYKSTSEDFQNRLREHFQDIAQVMAGGRIEDTGWEIPAFTLMLHDTSSLPGLSGNIFYVRMVQKDGTIVWRFDGLDGSHTEIPFAIGTYETHSCHSSYSFGGPVNESCAVLDNGRKYKVTYQVSAWPGKEKPILTFALGSTPMTESHKEEYAMVDEITQRVGKRPEYSNLLYLDRKGKHRIMVGWFDTGSELSRLNDLIRQGQSGSATLGAISTDMPLTIPKAEPGIYLVRLVVTDASRPPHFEIARPDMRYVPAWHGTSFAMPKGKPEDYLSYWPAVSRLRPPYEGNTDKVQITVQTSSAGRDGFPFCFDITGRPDGMVGRDKTWTSGVLHVKKP